MKKNLFIVLFITLMFATETNSISPYRFYKRLIKKESIAKEKED